MLCSMHNPFNVANNFLGPILLHLIKVTKMLHLEKVHKKDTFEIIVTSLHHWILKILSTKYKLNENKVIECS